MGNRVGWNVGPINYTTCVVPKQFHVGDNLEGALESGCRTANRVAKLVEGATTRRQAMEELEYISWCVYIPVELGEQEEARCSGQICHNPSYTIEGQICHKSSNLTTAAPTSKRRASNALERARPSPSESIVHVGVEKGEQWSSPNVVDLQHLAESGKGGVITLGKHCSFGVVITSEKVEQVLTGGRRATFGRRIFEGAEYKDYEKGPSQITELETLRGFVDWKGRPILKDKHGGKRATAFIFVMEGLENMALLGIQFKTNLIFASIELTGYILMTIQAHYPSLRPPKCNISDAISDCKHVTGGKAAMFYMGLYLMALGTGGLKAALPSLGADQFDEKDPQERRFMSSFFNWFALSINVGACIGVTCLVWIENNRGWDIGFGSCVGAVFVAIVSLVLGLPRYRNQIPQGSPLTRIAQVRFHF
eukprot:Gb_24460 [translate_table: standard]